MDAKLNVGKTKLSLDNYAIQGNAILGIRGAGKTYGDGLFIKIERTSKP